MKNNQSSVKNYKTDEEIKLIYENKFGGAANNFKVSKLSGGMKNAVYLVENGKDVFVLKIAPKEESKMITVDRNVMWWEAKMLDLMDSIDFPSPKLLCFDDSCSVCDSPFLFMSSINGDNFEKVKNEMSPLEKARIETEIGFLSSKICSFESDKYFIPSQPNKSFDSNFSFVKNLFDLLVEDAKNGNLDFEKNKYDKIMNIIVLEKESLNSANRICLSHTDIWDGNILVKDGSVTGIVDFSDLYYCDELLTFYFHTIDGRTSENFLNGFNKKKIDNAEHSRIDIYRMYVIFKMIVDCKLKNYGKFDWMYKNLDNRIEGFQKTKRLR